MTKDHDVKTGLDLRKKAEKALLEAPEHPDPFRLEDMNRLKHELSVHEIELEMQNEELRRSREQLEESSREYQNLYDFAPVGYLTLDEKGLITKVNLTAASLLGAERSLLLRTPFALLIHPESTKAFHLHLRRTLEAKTTQTCQLVPKRRDGTFFDVHLESISVQANTPPPRPSA
jgi:PAS domain S-box-containing protein